MITNNKDKMDLYEAIVSLESPKECQDFFADLCTINEIDAMAQRYKAAKMISEKKTYEQIIEVTEISSATLSRVSKSFQYGNGYRHIIGKQKKKEEENK